jgi:hypothetical protein
MFDDLCSTYKFEEERAQELTELAYILFESLKESLVHNDLIKILPKWKQMGFIHIFAYLQKM